MSSLPEPKRSTALNILEENLVSRIYLSLTRSPYSREHHLAWQMGKLRHRRSQDLPGAPACESGARITDSGGLALVVCASSRRRSRAQERASWVQGSLHLQVRTGGAAARLTLVLEW